MIQRKFFAAAVCVAASFPCLSSNVFLQSTISPASPQSGVPSITSLSSSLQNPAAPSYLSQNKNGWHINMLAPIAVGYELGKIDSLVDELDALIDILEKDDLTAQEALDVKDRFEPFLKSASIDGTLKAAGSVGLPLLPIFYSDDSIGTFSFNLSASGAIRSSVLDDDIEIVNVGDSFRINTSAAVYVKSVAMTALSLGYSYPVYQRQDSQMFLGTNIHLKRLSLAKNVISLSALEDGTDIEDAIEDDYENNVNSTTALGIDTGVIWASGNYTLGLLINDINEPEYKYNTIGDTCSNLTGVSIDNCFVAQGAVATGKISGNEVFISNRQSTLSASAWYGGHEASDSSLAIHASYDLNDKNDPLGDLYQWANVGITGNLGNWLLPQVRLGYKKNLVGSELSYYSLGFTFLGRANIDVIWTNEEVDIDDSSAPRSAFVNVSIQSRF